ncbi:MAG TPA: aminoglycoside adenylyltransferase family protein [Actinomycetota bacterium]|nr:aminoglycoside adenylyltransferase family protein [Actinomycetota bacterium]
MEEVVAVLRDALGDALVGAYLHGSAVLGGLRADSDLDVLAVSARETTDDEKRKIASGLLAVSGDRSRGDGQRPIELTIVAASEVRPWRYPPRRDFQYGEWLRERFERGDPDLFRPTIDPDVAILVTMVRLGDVTMTGSAAGTTFDEVPPRDLAAALVADIPGLIDDIDWDTRNVVLTLARMWNTVVTGRIRSKDAAAEWALERLAREHRPVLARAREGYLRGNESWEDLRAQVLPFAHAVVAEIEAGRR